MIGVIATIPRVQFSNALGIPLAGGKLITYLAGTTTPEPTFQDQELTIANPTTITLDATGSCTLWLDPTKTYKFLLKNLLGATQPGWPVDNISGASSLASLVPTFSLYAKLAVLAAVGGTALIGFLQAGVGAIARTLFDKLTDILSIMDFGPSGLGGDDIAALEKAINSLGTKSSGNLYNANGKVFRISRLLDLTVLGPEHRQYKIDLSGATFIWIGDPNYTGPMVKMFNNKSVTIENFTLLGSPDKVKSKVTGIWIDSLQPDGADLISLRNYRIAYCDTGIAFGSTAVGQNRVSDSQIGNGVIENCRVGVSLRSTDVDSLIVGPCLIISACTMAIEMQRAGFVKVYDVTGYACEVFVSIKGPTEAILIENCQSERGDLASSIFLYRNVYTQARRAPITLKSCVVDDKIWIDYVAQLGSDAQTLNIIGGLFTDMAIDAPDTTVNLIGTTQVAGGVMAISGANSKVNNFGTRMFGDTADYANARRFSLFGDADNNFAIGAAVGQYATAGRSVLYMEGATGALLGLGVNGSHAGYIASGAGIIEIAAEGVNQTNLTAGGTIVARVRNNGAFKLVPRPVPPPNPEEGDTYADSVLKKVRYYDGTTWQNFF